MFNTIHLLLLAVVLLLMLFCEMYERRNGRSEDDISPGSKAYLAGVIVLLIDIVLWLIFGGEYAVVNRP